MTERTHPEPSVISSASSPWRRWLNVRASILLLVTAIVLGGQLLSFGLTRDLLTETVHEREAEKASAVGMMLESLVSEYAEGARMSARVLSSSERLAGALRSAPPALSSLEAIIRPLLADDRLDILDIVDDQSSVVYRSQAGFKVGEKSDAWGVGEALTGKPSLVAHRTADGLSVLAIAPVMSAGRPVGAVLAGRLLDQAFLMRLSTQVHADLALVSRSQVLGTSSALRADSLDHSAIDEAFAQKIAVHRRQPQGHASVVYLPMLIVDEGFVMVVRIDSSSAYRTLERGFGLVLNWTLALLALSMLVSFGLLSRLLRPLKALRRRAEQIAIRATGSGLGDGVGARDEVGAVVQALDGLTERLLDRNQALDIARTQAQSASDAKSQFLSNMSHEIRTPLNGILGMAELLRDTSLTVDQRRYCQAIATSGRALYELLSDILDLSKIEAGKIQLEAIDFDLSKLLDDLHSAFVEIAATRSNRLVIEPKLTGEAWVRGDPTRLRQVLSNLVGNAIKFTGNGRITVKVDEIASVEDPGRRWLRFEVNDTGIGIPPDKLKQLFQAFTQADSSTTRQYGGTGLGLVICKHLVELLGGQIMASSTPGEGTRFWFSLPFEPAQAQAEEAPAHARSLNHAGVRVLLAEDNAVNRDVITAMLEQAGMEVRSVVNGEFAVQAMRQERFDLVLMDCQMPVMNGFDATRLIRREEDPADPTPIVALTANAFAEDREQCLAAGMNDFLTKPIQRETLIRGVAAWSHRRADSTTAPPPTGTVAMNMPEVANIPEDAGSVLEDPAAPLAAAVLDQLIEDIGLETTAATIQMFLDGKTDEQQAIDECAKLGDLQALAGRLHALKSSSALLGGQRLAQRLQTAETLARGGDTQAWQRLEGIASALDEFCAALAAHPCRSMASDAI